MTKGNLINIISRCKAILLYTLLFVMEKDLKYIELFDLYSGLLTEKQKEIFTSYYIFDLSLSEIAEPEGRTRQSVHEILKSACEKLAQYESVLKLNEKYGKIIELAKEISDKELTDKLLEIIGK